MQETASIAVFGCARRSCEAIAVRIGTQLRSIDLGRMARGSQARRFN